MNLETRFCGHWVVAAAGKGKTNLLIHMLADDLQKDYCIIIMDSKGELTAPIRKLALGDRLIVLDPREPFALNPLDVPRSDVRRVVNHIEYIFGALLDANVTAKQQALLRSILRTLIIGFPSPSLQSVQELINTDRPSIRFAEYISKLPSDLQFFFSEEWRDYDTTRSELKWRLRLVMENDLIRESFSAPYNRFRIGNAMDSGKVVVIDNAQEHLDADGCAFLGRFFLAQIWSAATARSSRPRDQKRPVFVYIDEAHLIIKKDQKITAIIDECRSQNVGLILAHQRMKQVEELNVLSALENCAIKMVNVGAEANYFSKLMQIPEERISRLPRGQFAMDVRDQEPSIVDVPLARLPFRNMTPQEEHQLKHRMKELYGVQGPTTYKSSTEAEPLHATESTPAEAEKPIIPPETPTGKKPYW